MKGEDGLECVGVWVLWWCWEAQEFGELGKLGERWVRRKEQVRENMEKAHAKCVFDDGTLVGIWRVPGLRMFEPRGSDGELIGRSFGGAVDFSL